MHRQFNDQVWPIFPFSALLPLKASPAKESYSRGSTQFPAFPLRRVRASELQGEKQRSHKQIPSLLKLFSFPRTSGPEVSTPRDVSGKCHEQSDLVIQWQGPPDPRNINNPGMYTRSCRDTAEPESRAGLPQITRAQEQGCHRDVSADAQGRGRYEVRRSPTT